MDVRELKEILDRHLHWLKKDCAGRNLSMES